MYTARISLVFSALTAFCLNGLVIFTTVDAFLDFFSAGGAGYESRNDVMGATLLMVLPASLFLVFSLPIQGLVERKSHFMRTGVLLSLLSSLMVLVWWNWVMWSSGTLMVYSFLWIIGVAMIAATAFNAFLVWAYGYYSVYKS